MITSLLRTLPFLVFTALLLNLATTEAADISGFDLGSVEIQVLGSSSKISMGQYGEVAQFRVRNRTGRNLSFESLRLRNYGTADLTKSFENILVTTSTGEILTSTVQASRKYWTWQFRDGVQLGRGDSVILSVRARLIYSKRGQTVELGMRRDEDLAVNDLGSGFGIRCTNCQGTRLKTQRLGTGGVYITRQSTYQRSSRYYGSRERSKTPYSDITDEDVKNVRVLRTSTYNRSAATRYIPTPRGNQKYSPGAKDVVFFSSRLNSRTGISVDGIFLQLGSGSVASSGDIDDTFGNWRLLINGVYEDSSSDLETYNGQTGVLFNSSMQIPANSQIVMTGRVKNNAKTGDKVRFSLTRSGLIDPEYLYSGSSVDSINGGSSSNYSKVR